MSEHINILVNTWKSVIAKGAPWAMMAGMMFTLFDNVSTVSEAAESEAAFETTVITMQELALFDLMLPIMLLIIITTIFMPLMMRV